MWTPPICLPHERRSWIKLAHDFGYEAHAVFFDVPPEVCIERNRRRERNVPEDVMQRMAAKLRPPKFEEGFAKITVVRLRRKRAKPRLPESLSSESKSSLTKPSHRTWQMPSTKPVRGSLLKLDIRAAAWAAFSCLPKDPPTRLTLENLSLTCNYCCVSIRRESVSSSAASRRYESSPWRN